MAFYTFYYLLDVKYINFFSSLKNRTKIENQSYVRFGSVVGSLMLRTDKITQNLESQTAAKKKKKEEEDEKEKKSQ